MGVFPRRNAKVTMKLFNPIAKYLSRKLGREVELVISKDFESFWEGVTEQRYDLVHYNQYHYLESHKKYGYQVIAKNEEFGSSRISGVITIRVDSGIRSVLDLKGKKIVFGGGPKAMMSYIVPTYLLREGGLRAGDYEEAFARNPPNAILSAYFRQSAAAGAGRPMLRSSPTL
ncbi:MAG: PhnD/SsuA/transferrin family substrate-binding protein [Gammaproteobacteria bacterium]